MNGILQFHHRNRSLDMESCRYQSSSDNRLPQNPYISDNTLYLCLLNHVLCNNHIS